MKRFLFLSFIICSIIFLTSCANQPGQNNNQDVPPTTDGQTPIEQNKNINPDTGNDNQAADTGGITQDDLDKLKAEINNLQFDNPNGLSQ